MKKKLPVGIESFEEIRTDGYYYIDKTMLVSELLKWGGKVTLCTRPRRFGKTLNMSMLKSFFEIGCDKTLFDGLAISEDTALCEAHMGKYPVVFISLKGVDGLNFADACEMMKQIIQREARNFQFLLTSDKLTQIEKEAAKDLYLAEQSIPSLQGSLATLSELLYKHYGKKVVMLIDEYDVPLDKAYQHGYYDEMVSLIRTMFSQALKTNDYLQFAVLTGCLRIAKESLFTGLNNFMTMTISDVRFDEYFGFVDSEVRALLNDYDLSAHYDSLKEWYDGYHFGNVDVYCPWDVINHCAALLVDLDTEPQPYWLNTSGNIVVRRIIDHADDGNTQDEIERLIAGECVHKRIDENLTYNEIDASIENMWSLLYATGYLTTMEKPQAGIYALVVPNREIRTIFISQVRTWFADQIKTQSASLSTLYGAFESGNTDTIKEYLDEQLLSTISFYDAQESFYHGFLLALLNGCADWTVVSNEETGKGRSDITVRRRDRSFGCIVEVKHVRKSETMESMCQEAIAQIERNQYAAVMKRYRVKNVRLFGITFCDKECCVVTKTAQ